MLQKFMTPFYEKITIKNTSSLKGKTILITGSNGLIGGNFVAFLDYLSENLDLKLKIIGISNSKKASWLPDSKHITYIQENLVSKEQKTFSYKFDYLIHAATYAQPKKFLEHQRQTIDLNINTLFTILEQAKKNNAKMLYISSSEIYGETSARKPAMESYFGSVNTLSDRAIYAESKRLAETICYSYRNDVNIKIARVLLSYGPGVKTDDSRVYSEFIQQAQTTGKIVMMDKGQTKRTFCFISDAIEMLLNTLLSGHEFVYNIAGRDTTTISGLAKQIAEVNNARYIRFTGKIKEISGTPVNSIISNDRYCKEFKKKSFIDLSQGLQATSEWFNNLG
jgi:dTDP-glucose 4,6-dehydratase/UDP-glucuronate decarboxylase